MKLYKIASGIVRYRNKILLVEHKPKTDSKHRMWRNNRHQPFWTLPGGKAEAEDGTLLDTALREIWEETGISLKPSRPPVLLYDVAFDDPDENWQCQGHVFAFDITEYHQEKIVDPDDSTIRAEFIDIPIALSLLETIDVAPMRDPVMAALRLTNKPSWHYKLDGNLKYRLI